MKSSISRSAVRLFTTRKRTSGRRHVRDPCPFARRIAPVTAPGLSSAAISAKVGVRVAHILLYEAARVVEPLPHHDEGSTA